ncbi:hypothetical protein [Paraburkholderia tagetis]|uniref:Uncharacterized protein n=1 Tax=Paraburkholderia tagetis TaxID=2913261 RepID=A0A9X2A3E2_9BURK|nr:hypothetical protein [Paraburkholderia tagetis]MCG5079056.1 hypothetical protein [Paraburkholderia tagetis]
MTIASIAPLPVEVVPPIPGPQSYLHRYEFQYQAGQRTPFDVQLPDFYSVQLAHDFRFGDFRFGGGDAGPASGTVQRRQTSTWSQMGASTAPTLALREFPNATLIIGAQPQRRLSLSVDDWVFSATARLAILHSHSTGATVTVRRGF